ncbi:cupin domain-containing protein [Litoribacter ruber]|uniref:Cupin domain-containing protein n=1 Tax=Litoribacter ruber TaxID=702568 RepID=A0AAP2CEP8_9BACT|nr:MULTISPECIES: cupin domain-containing protein [Litoribacter]MBS9523111.1 cupin domain-containing protein [Litoribacter alkaliphilus]MBT0810726.1 cupin domain-containing protein [Litoribacter ruber]
MRVKLYPNSDNPLHFHKSYTQEVKATDGTVCIKLKGGERTFLKSGDSFLVEKSIPHAVINPSQVPIEYEITCRPGQANIEKGYRLKFELENQDIKPTLLDDWLLMDLRGTYPIGFRYKVFAKLKTIFLFKWMLYKRLDQLEKKVRPQFNTFHESQASTGDLESG